MARVHFVLSNKGETRHVVCMADTGAVFDINGVTDNPPEKDSACGMTADASDSHNSGYTVDSDKIIYIGGKKGPLTRDVIAAEMAKKNLSTDEIANVWGAFSGRYPNRRMPALPQKKAMKAPGRDSAPS